MEARSGFEKNAGNRGWVPGLDSRSQETKTSDFKNLSKTSFEKNVGFRFSVFGSVLTSTFFVYGRCLEQGGIKGEGAVLPRPPIQTLSHMALTRNSKS